MSDGIKYKFEIQCMQCGSRGASIIAKSEPYWDDDYLIVCPDCDNKAEDDAETFEYQE